MMQKDRSTATKGASIRPSSFKVTRHWTAELKAYVPGGARGKPYGHSFGVRGFPSDLAAWLEAIADAHDRKVGEVEAFCIGEGARLLLSLKGVDRYRNARRAVAPYGPQHVAWFNTFRFPIETEHVQREDFQVTKTEWGHICTLVKILRLPVPQLVPLCIMAVGHGPAAGSPGRGAGNVEEGPAVRASGGRAGSGGEAEGGRAAEATPTEADAGLVR